MTRSLDAFFYMCLNKRPSKQSRRRWFETLDLSWRHCNDIKYSDCIHSKNWIDCSSVRFFSYQQCLKKVFDNDAHSHVSPWHISFIYDHNTAMFLINTGYIHPSHMVHTGKLNIGVSLNWIIVTNYFFEITVLVLICENRLTMDNEICAYGSLGCYLDE